MKTLCSILFAFFLVNLHAQTDSLHYVITDNHVMYRTVNVKPGVTIIELKNMLKGISNMNNIQADSAMLSADYGPFLLNYKKYGYSWVNMAVIAGSSLFCHVIIDVDKDRFRITVKDIEYSQPSGTTLINSRQRNQLDIYIKNNKLPDNKAGKNFFIALDKQLTETFLLKSAEKW